MGYGVERVGEGTGRGLEVGWSGGRREGKGGYSGGRGESITIGKGIMICS